MLGNTDLKATKQGATLYQYAPGKYFYVRDEYIKSHITRQYTY